MKLLILAAVLFVISFAVLIFAVGYKLIGLLFLGLACLCVLLWLLGRMRNAKAARIIKIALFSVIAIGVIMVAVAEIRIIGSARTDESPEADYLIVLGAGLNGKTPSLSLTNRLNAALDYLNTYPESTAVVSGGQGSGEDITEALAMRLWLEQRGIDSDRIIEEDRSTSTMENLTFSLDIIDDDTASIAIVSSEYHLYRAKLMAAELGVEAKTVAARTTYPVLMANYLLREALAVWHHWVF